MDQFLKMFQDLARCRNELAISNEQEVFKLLEIMERLQQNCKSAEAEAIEAKHVLLSYENDLAEARAEGKELKSQLVEAKSQIAGLVSAREHVERDCCSLKKKFSLIRGLLDSLPEDSRRKLQLLSETQTTNLQDIQIRLVENEISCDRIEDSLETCVFGLVGEGHGNDAQGNRAITITRQDPKAESHMGQVPEFWTPTKHGKDEILSHGEGAGFVPSTDQQGESQGTSTYFGPIGGGAAFKSFASNKARTPNKKFFRSPRK